MPDKSLSARIEVFRPGTFTPMQGNPISYSAADLRAIADAYDPGTAPAPVVVGHPGIDAPAFGWVKSFDYDAQAERLFANLHEIEPAFAGMVKAGRFKKVSMQYFRPDQPNNPAPGTWYPKHVGFLGAAAPAVPGLKPVAFADDDGVTFEAAFGDPGFEEVAGLFQRLREWLIGERGLEAADGALPSWRIEWLRDHQPTPSPDPSPAYGDPQTQPQEEPAVPETDGANFAEREANIAAREAVLAARERELAAADNVSFAEALVAEGRLLPALKDKLVAILGALPSEPAVSFAAGEEAISPVAAIKALFEAQPKLVSFGEIELPAAGSEAQVSFAADGREVDAERLAIHEKALAFQRTNPGSDYIAAVKAVS